MKRINFSENRLRFIFVFVALFFFMLSLMSFYNNMIARKMTTDDCLWVPMDMNGNKLYIREIIPGGVADEAGLKENDILIAINGQEFKNTNDAMNILNRYSNEIVTYTIIRNGIYYNVNIWVYKYFNILYFITWLLGFGFLSVGLMVGYSKPKELTSKLFFFLGCAATIGLIKSSNPIGFFDIMQTTIVGRLGIFILYAVFFNSLILFAPLLLHFLLTFPIKYEFKRRKIIIILMYILSYLIPIILIFLGKSNTPLNPSYFTIQLTIFLIVGIILFSHSYKKVKDITLKKSLRIINYGFVIGITGIIYIIILSLKQKPDFLIKPYLMIPCILILAIPFSFGFAIFKYRILDTELVVKKGLVFGIVTVIIIGFYFLLIYTLDKFLKEFIQSKSQFITIAFILLFTLTFDYVNKKSKDFVDRIFYRERYNYRKSLLKFSQEISFINNINDLLEKICDSVKNTMGIEEINLWLNDKSYYSIVDNNLLCKNYKNYSDYIDSAIYKIFLKSKSPAQLNAANLTEYGLTKEEQKIILDNKIALSIPIVLKNKLIGSFNFGSKASGKAYSDEDIDLLKTLAIQTAISFENSKLRIEEINKQKIEEELKIAKGIQIGLLPKEDFHIDGLDITGYSEPAKIIGGDYFDFIKLNDKKLILVIADVSGKGIPAALYMSKVQAMIQFATQMFDSPKDILVEVNRQIYEQIDRKSFITMVIALFDLEKMKVKISRAGHNPVLYTRNGQVEILRNNGLGLGLENGTHFESNLEETILDLKTDDLFLFYTDGLNEAMNINKNEFGLNNVIKVIKENQNKSSKEIQTNLLDSVSSFRGEAEQNDDITFVVVKVK